jgi:hypothetical protein
MFQIMPKAASGCMTRWISFNASFVANQWKDCIGSVYLRFKAFPVLVPAQLSELAPNRLRWAYCMHLQPEPLLWAPDFS